MPAGNRRLPATPGVSHAPQRLVVFPILYRRDAKRQMHSRDAVFDECMNLPHSALKSRDKAHLRVLQGRCAGYAVALSVVEATIGRRKVPPLWLQVEGRVAGPAAAACHRQASRAACRCGHAGAPCAAAVYRRQGQGVVPHPVMGPEKGKPCTCPCPPRQRNRSLIRCLTLGTRLDGYVRQQTDGNSATT